MKELEVLECKIVVEQQISNEPTGLHFKLQKTEISPNILSSICITFADAQARECEGKKKWGNLTRYCSSAPTSAKVVPVRRCIGGSP